MRSISAAFAACLLLAPAGPVSAQPAPAPLTVLDVPFISQSEALCGGAAAAMVLRYWGDRGLTAESFAHLVDRSAAGIRTTALIAELRARGWSAAAIDGDGSQIDRELDRGRPVLALIEDRPGTFHYVVIVAATPRAIVFHDPARAPVRVFAREEFERRWRAAGRWMAMVVPGEGNVEANEPGMPAEIAAPATACERLVAEGVERAQANDFESAERRLTAALSCPGAAALRELAGVRLLQRRWPDVEALASAAAAIDPADAHAWRLLGTSRFVQDDRLGALDAWNHVSEPRLDLIGIDGLRRTRHRVVERLIGESAGVVVTPERFLRAARRLEELPAATATRIQYLPVPSGLAELRATVVERPLAPSGVWEYMALGLSAAARREVAHATGSLGGAGERISAAWRFWPGRPRFEASLAAPAPWGGTWGVDVSKEKQIFDRREHQDAARTAGELWVGNWLTSTVHVAVRGGVHEWANGRTFGAAGAALRIRTGGDRLDARFAATGWMGESPFGTIQGLATARSSAARTGRVYVATGGAALTSAFTPLDAWFGGDTGDTGPRLLRAHPLVEDGRLQSARLGRRIAHGSAEAQQWWSLFVARVAAALFMDAAVVDRRLEQGVRGDLDAGAGLRLALPGVAGTFRIDLARGVRDGAQAWSFVYEP